MTPPDPKSRPPIQFKSAQLEAKLILRAVNSETPGAVAKAYLEQYLQLLDSVSFTDFSESELRYVQSVLCGDFFHFSNAHRVWAIVEDALGKIHPLMRNTWNLAPENDRHLIDRLKALDIVHCLALWDRSRQYRVEFDEFSESI